MTEAQPSGRTIDTFQLEGESGTAYAAFMLYRDLGPTRSINAAYTKSKAQTGAPEAQHGNLHAPGTWRSWAKKHRWEERARGWDGRNHQVAQVAHEQAIANTVRITDEEWARRRERLRSDEFALAESLLAKAKQMLAFPLVRKKTEDNGQTVIFEPVKWSFATMAQLIEVASKLSRMAANMPLEITEDPPDDLRDLMFQTSGQIAAATPGGLIPEMPADVFQKPNITTGKPTAGVDGAPRKPAKVRPA